MLQKRGSKAARRIALMVLAVAMLASLAVPMVAAGATTVPRSSLLTSTRYMPVARSFIISGRISYKFPGRKVAVEIRKPGRTHWDQVAILTTNKAGAWSVHYTPKLGGKFYIRARFIARNSLSRTAALTVKVGPSTKSRLVLASTTSTKDSGLFERLGPAFRAACPEYALVPTFVGSGAAMALGGAGNADVLLTHSPDDEAAFMNGIVAGNPTPYRGLTRNKVMYNDFVLVGPVANPAGVVNDASPGAAAAAFQSIATAGSTFWSRNDKSGTNSKEKKIWASLSPKDPQIGQPWYKASGTMGMAQALATANDAGTSGYTLSDRATWLSASSLGIVKNLKIVNAGDPILFNQYAVIEVKGARNKEGAQDFSNWIRSPQAQALIKTFGEYTYPGQVMFEPNAGPYPW